MYAEIASIEEQHVTQYESIIDPSETWLEKWVLHEATEAYNYYSCVEQEANPRIKALWERFLDYELGQLNYVAELFKKYERRDPAEIISDTLPEPIPFKSNREFVRKVLSEEVNLRALGTQFADKSQESQASLEQRRILNSEGSPSQTIAAGYQWSPGTELNRKIA